MSILRVAIVTPDYPPVTGGVSASCDRLSQNLARYGAHIHVFVPVFDPRASRPEYSHTSSGNVEVTRISVAASAHEDVHPWALSGLGPMSQLFLVLRQLLTAWQPDIVQSFTLFPFANLAGLVAHLLRRPFLVGVRGGDLTSNMFRPDLLASLMLPLERADVIVPVSSDLAELAIALCPDAAKRIIVVSNGIDVDRPRPVRANGGDQVRFGTACMFRPKKDLDILVSAYLRLRPENACELRLIGPLDERRFEAKYPNHSSLGITLIGSVTRVEVLDAISELDVFVITSVFDGCANAMLEAMALGIPVIASRVGGARDLIDHGRNGLLFEPLQLNELVSCMKKVLSPDTRSRLGSEGQTTVRTGDDEANAWFTVYQQAARRRQSREAGSHTMNGDG